MASSKSKFDPREWYIKLIAENRFTPKKKNVEGKMCYVINSGFVAHYAGLETDMQKRQVRAFLLKSFKRPECKYPEFSRMNDAQLKAFMEAQEAYSGRAVVKETTAKKKLKALPSVPENNISKRAKGMAMNTVDEVCHAYKILNGLIEGMFTELSTKHGKKIDISLIKEQQKLIRNIKSCMDLTPDPGFYEPILALIKEKLPSVELSNPFLKLLQSSPPELTLKKVKSFTGSLQRGTKVLFKLKSTRGGMRTRKRAQIKRRSTLKKNK